jgi:hypothetical protein
MLEARDSAIQLIKIGEQLNDPRSFGSALTLLNFIAMISESYAEALDYSEQTLAVAITPNERHEALFHKSNVLILLRRTEEGAVMLEEFRRLCATIGNLLELGASDGTKGICSIFQGKIGEGIRLVEETILRQEKNGYRDLADWARIILADVYLQIIARNEKVPFLVLLKNLPILLKVSVTAPSRIRALMKSPLENQHFHPEGHHVGRANMILGLLYVIKKNQALAAQHLTEAKRILSQFGQSPILARVDTALAELKK